MTGSTEKLKGNGYTLLEMMVVAGLMALLSTVAVLHYRGPLERIRAEQAAERIDLLDLRVRTWTREHGRAAQLVIDPDEGRIWAQSEGRIIEEIPDLKLESGLRWGELRLRGETLVDSNCRIGYTTAGVAPLWAYSLILPNDREIYRMMIGATGQSEECDSLETIELWEKACDDRE